MIGDVVGDERAGTGSPDEIAFVQELLVRAQHRQSRDAKIGRKAPRGRNPLPRLQPAIENGAAQSVIDLPEYRNAGGAVERNVQVAMPNGRELAMAKLPLSGILGETRRIGLEDLMESTVSIPDQFAPDSIRIASPGHVAFAVAMIGLGVIGLVTHRFTQIWQPVPKWVPARAPLAFLCALISLGSGLGLLWRRSAAMASRLLFVSLSAWLLVLRLPNLFYEKPLVLVAWTFGATAVMLAGAWVLVAWFAQDGEPSRLGFFTGAKGVRTARTLYGLSLIPFGLAHFMYLDATTVLIPTWLPWHVAWAYFTGAAFIAAGLAVSVGVLAPLAAALSALQMGLFSVIVWVPRALTGNLNDFQRGEVVSTFVLTAGAWMVADSYRASRLTAPRRRR